MTFLKLRLWQFLWYIYDVSFADLPNDLFYDLSADKNNRYD